MKRLLSLLFSSVLLLVCLSGCGGGDGGSGSVNNSTLPSDTSKPIVISTTPAHNSVGVGTSNAIMVTFNEAINPATINTQTFTLMKDGITPVTGTVTCAGTTAEFKPDSTLSTVSSYTATVTTGVKDLAGNAIAANYSWQFSTSAGPDITPLSVLATFPAANSVGTALNSVITVTFNKPISPPATADPQPFVLKKDGAVVTGKVTYVGATALFKPDSTLANNALYTAAITTGMKDLAGNSLAGDGYTWNFTTGSAPDNLSPQVLSVSPLPGATNVPVNSSLVIPFNEAIMPSFQFGLIDGRPVAVTFNATYTELTITPTVAMQSGTSYTVSLKVRDMADNQMTVPYTWTFSTTQ